MALLGIPLVVVLACAAVLLPVGTFLLWSHVHGPRVVRGGTRLGMLLTGQLATVLLVAALANDYGQFYTSWSDLFGTGSGQHTVSTFGAAGAPRASRSLGHPRSPVHRPDSPVRPAAATTTRTGGSGRLQVLGATSWSSRAQWATRGKVESVDITGLQSGLSVQGYLYLPPQYFQRAWAHHRFPAVEAITGYPGSALALVTRLGYPSVSLKLVQEHRSQPTIFVMLPSMVVPPRDTECTDVPHGPQAETFFGQEVPSAVQTALRVKPNDWGVAGDSTGGYCATKILMDHPAVFRAGISLSGYYYAREDRTTGSLWAGDVQLQHLNDPEWLLHRFPAPPVSLFLTTSKDETHRDGYPDAMRFLHEVRPPMHVTALVEAHGGHNFATWDRELPIALRWLSRLQ
ncbi:MAG TPA: alpha/beta hydrolase-fold protein [Segeticoccus sp.]|uniref:alpha/beta hydrolase n=1 Tax=Segeticoccus sp. TaxID=2706531 RepID=UPI002D7EDDA2|nr:alpha/beta hydrolase-fold protein [Segeticoccus sp.]HET8598839.1 alpha/beta hydrolase-fold protein [Segeticoccus sp.]